MAHRNFLIPLGIGGIPVKARKDWWPKKPGEVILMVKVSPKGNNCQFDWYNREGVDFDKVMTDSAVRNARLIAAVSQASSESPIRAVIYDVGGRVDVHIYSDDRSIDSGRNGNLVLVEYSNGDKYFNPNIGAVAYSHCVLNPRVSDNPAEWCVRSE